MGSRAFVSVDETPTDTLREMRTARELPQPQSAIRRLRQRKYDNEWDVKFMCISQGYFYIIHLYDVSIKAHRIVTSYKCTLCKLSPKNKIEGIERKRHR